MTNDAQEPGTRISARALTSPPMRKVTSLVWFRNALLATALLAFAIAFTHEARGIPCAGVADLAKDVRVEPAAGWLLPEVASPRFVDSHSDLLSGVVTSHYQLGPFLIESVYTPDNYRGIADRTVAHLYSMEGDAAWSPDLFDWVNYDKVPDTFSLRADDRDDAVVLMAKNLGSDGAEAFRVHYHAGAHRFTHPKRLGASAFFVIAMLALVVLSKRRLRLLDWKSGEVDSNGNIVDTDSGLVAQATLHARLPAETAVLYRLAPSSAAASYRASDAPRVVDVVLGNHNDVKLFSSKLNVLATCAALGAVASAASLVW